MNIRFSTDSMSGRLLWLLVFAGPFLLPGGILRVPSMLFFVAIVPALFLTARMPLGSVGRLALTLTTSPLLVGLLTLVLLWIGSGTQTAPWIAVTLFAACFAIFGRGVGAFEKTDVKLLRTVTIVVAVAAALAFILPLTNLWWRTRSDSWFHASIFTRLVTQGLPIEDPYFTPLRLQYMYFYHVILLCASRLGGLGAFYAMIAVNAIALAGVSLGLLWLSEFFTKRVAARIGALALCLFGMNGFFYLFLPVRMARGLFGETRGIEPFFSIFSLSPPGHDTATAFIMVNNNQFLFLDKFLLGTALSLSLGPLCAVLALLLRGFGTTPIRHEVSTTGEPPVWRMRYILLYLINFVGLLMLHVIIGATVYAAVAGALAIVWLVKIRTATSLGAGLGRVVTATGIALVIAVPYILAVVPGGGGKRSIELGLQGGHLIGLLSSLLAVLVLSALYMRMRTPKIMGGERPIGYLFFLTWLAFVTLAAIALNLPTTNETKFSFILFVPLAALSAGGIDVWLSRGRTKGVVVFIALAIVPLNVVYFGCAFQDRSEFVITDDERSTYEWIHDHTAQDAVFIDNHDRVRIPVLAARDQYWGTKVYADVWGYPVEDMNARRSIRDRIFSGGQLTGKEVSTLAALKRPIYIMCRLEDPSGEPTRDGLLAGGFASVAFENRTVVVLRLRLTE